MLLLLFGLGPRGELRPNYEAAMTRIFSERAAELKGGSIAVKIHPGASGVQEQLFIDWLKERVPAQVFAINHHLNLEFMLPQLRPDLIFAGLCGALPVLKRLDVGRPVLLREFVTGWLHERPDEVATWRAFVDALETW
jgi:hypothetical protein